MESRFFCLRCFTVPEEQAAQIPSVVNSFAYEPIINDEIYLQLSQLNPRKASGPDYLPNKFLKLLAPTISPLLANTFNECFEVGKFPATLMQAKVIAIHKTGPKNVASNYRPISLLSPVSKVFKKLLYIKLEKFLTKHNIISTQQYGFREGHSTEMAIVDLTNKLKLDIDEGYFTCCQRWARYFFKVTAVPVLGTLLKIPAVPVFGT